MRKKVSIQGFEGSFHQVAARHFYGKDTEVICCASFKELVRIAADKKQSDGGIMAIENSIAGSILPNYNLLLKSNLRIVGEVYLQIKQHLLVNPGVKLADIREVHSHPMAIQQCLGFLDKYNWRLVETEDTALSAKLLHQHRSRHIAAIAGEFAAELYALEIAAP
ncbi:MAG TPA: prephenate dehydratase domain-containing protein, partial [Ferruginibacter sp.]|nr:prephenate dehydratase domain-containing protein [Ferruginibacter sp.]